MQHILPYRGFPGGGGYRSCQTFLEKLFLCKFASQIVCCYLELLKSYKALKVSDINQVEHPNKCGSFSMTIQYILNIFWYTAEETHNHHGGMY